MHRPTRTAFVILAGALGLALSSGRAARASDDFAFHHENVMGTALELRVLAEDAEAARRAEGRVLGEIDRLSAIFSNHDPSSEFRRWQASPRGPMQVSPELFEVLRAADRWTLASGGAFDPRVHALSRLWSQSASKGRTPTAEEIRAARPPAGSPAWRLDPGARTAERLWDGPLSLDAIAKGFILERACEAGMRGDPSVVGLLLNVGGDLRVVGEAPRAIGIAPATGDSETAEPAGAIVVRDRAVATSGPSQRGLRIAGRWYSHILDPRTGLPCEGVGSATVVAERSADADALATILNVVSPEEGLRLVRSAPGAECQVVASDGRVFRSEGWRRFEPGPSPVVAFAQAAAPKAAAPAPKGEAKGATPSGASWGDQFELQINFEINNPDTEGGRYRRPYIAVWAENKEGFPVRNLELWVSYGGAGPYQWLPDLRRWSKADRARRAVDKTNMVDAISRSTRPPGKYKVVWDGKDDRGKPLPPGEYTITIDAAREHGTYQSIRKPVTLADRPFAEELKGNVEIKSASVEYRRKPPAK